ncbi:MAG: hypothetical protein QM578_19085 [Pantoea sp.]|uniref:hypothetical protein n=1 Tax=Pantoea sp. TaxID=69393 RepID=UPI0039E39BF3
MDIRQITGVKKAGTCLLLPQRKIPPRENPPRQNSETGEFMNSDQLNMSQAQAFVNALEMDEGHHAALAVPAVPAVYAGLHTMMEAKT